MAVHTGTIGLQAGEQVRVKRNHAVMILDAPGHNPGVFFTFERSD